MPRFELAQVHSLLHRMDQAVATHEDMLRARVRERRVVVGFLDPHTMVELVGKPEIQPVADEARAAAARLSEPHPGG